jgi:hypothetical protein
MAAPPDLYTDGGQVQVISVPWLPDGEDNRLDLQCSLLPTA